MSRKKQKRKCPACDSSVSKGSKTGYCKRHSKVYLMEKSGKKCKVCNLPLAPQNISEHCRIHRKIFKKSTEYARFHIRQSQLIENAKKSGEKVYEFKCWYPTCGKIFYTNNPYQRYCTDPHRALHQKSDDAQAFRASQRIENTISRLSSER